MKIFSEVGIAGKIFRRGQGNGREGFCRRLGDL